MSFWPSWKVVHLGLLLLHHASLVLFFEQTSGCSKSSPEKMTVSSRVSSGTMKMWMQSFIEGQLERN
jgi:hypothetical protein